MSIELTFSQEKDTKNTVRYQETECKIDGTLAEAAVGTLYVQKTALGSPPPKTLKVTIEPA